MKFCLQELRVGEIVIDHDLGLLQEFPAAQGQQTRIARARANQIHLALMLHGIDPPDRRRNQDKGP